MYVAMLQITEGVTQLIGYSQVSPFVMMGGGLYMWQSLDIVNLDFDLSCGNP